MKQRPVRWLDGDEAGGLERELLGQAPSAEPPSGAEDRIWAALSARLPPGPGGDGGGSLGGDGGGAAAGAGLGAAGHSVGVLGVLKAAGIGALAGLVVAGSAAVADQRSAGRAELRPSPVLVPGAERVDVPTTATAIAPAAPDQGARQALTARKAPSARALAAPAEPTSSVGTLEASPEARATQLREESEALQAVRAALRRGDAAGALATLEAARARFPASVLGQEREALAIQALALAGQRDAARSRARAFIAKFPNSPHTPTLSRFAEP